MIGVAEKNHGSERGFRLPEILCFPPGRRFEMSLWLAALTVCNLHLWQGSAAGGLAFLPSSVASGEWWRLFTWPFVHLSAYHLLLDGLAFLMLYAGLEEAKARIRLFYTGAAAAGSLLLSLGLAPEIGNIGLCGLSGVAHGLTAVTGWELLTRHPRGSGQFRTGALLLAGILCKSAVEWGTGQVLFASWHLGYVGQPVVQAHVGGVLGGLAAASFIHLGRKGSKISKGERT